MNEGAPAACPVTFDGAWCWRGSGLARGCCCCCPGWGVGAAGQLPASMRDLASRTVCCGSRCASDAASSRVVSRAAACGAGPCACGPAASHCDVRPLCLVTAAGVACSRAASASASFLVVLFVRPRGGGDARPPSMRQCDASARCLLTLALGVARASRSAIAAASWAVSPRLRRRGVACCSTLAGATPVLSWVPRSRGCRGSPACVVMVSRALVLGPVCCSPLTTVRVL